MSVNPRTPGLFDGLRQRGIELFRNRAWGEALEFFERAVTVEPDSAELHNYCARAFEGLGNYAQALRSLERALAIDPTNVSDLRNRAIVLKKLGRPGEALASYQAALSQAPDNTDLLVRSGILLNELDRREEALAQIDRAARQRPDDLEVLNARVIVLDNLQRYEEALNTLDRMLGLQPTCTDAINNTGMTLARTGRFKEALVCYDRSLALNSDQPQAIYNRSLVRLALGDWIRGFKTFESRWNTAPLNAAKFPGLGPVWLGDAELAKQTLLLYHEQGYGDTLQCVRYIPALAQRGARILLAVPPALQALMKSVPGVAEIVPAGQALPPHDLQTPLMSLPLAFRTTPDTIPNTTPYLTAATAGVKCWGERLGPRTKPRVGLVWGGRRYAPINYPRDIPLALLLPLLAVEADFIGLQKELSEADRELLDQIPHLRHVGESLEDFADTAALIENLDLVIAVDSAVAHLAGALGKPVWLLNRYASCWRWLQTGTDTAWYPTMRIFRQPAVGDWQSVVDAATSALAAFVARQPDAGRRLPVVSSDRREAWVNANDCRQKAEKLKIRFVCATRLGTQEFFGKAPLGRSLPIYRTFPRHQVIELRLFPENREGLSTVYNLAIEESRTDPAILVFCHDDVYLSDFYWAEHLQTALGSFDLVGLAGNRRRVPRQASWMFLDDEFLRDNYDNLSGVLGHGDPFPNLKQLSVYGEPGQEVKLLDGVLMGIRSTTLIERDLRFDPRFKFHFYDLDFCRQAEQRQLRMGTCALSVVHASAGALGVDSWRSAYREYLTKYGET